ncbi:squalene synthase HpnC [Vogesella sp. LIG4]|uniref:squalene synthase HpnC n=1 Tax=Vogesella sp. LIG4 TaxID=1192162 RepID=UPI00081FB01D|nr:squalene synthase HpnC [Vogesella sp. LIG4]SCK22645.1 squalene synthase HpnC [Vogesella sp. LIG4]
MAVDHYENFPVGSLALPRRMRKAVHVIYRFARHADDIADEGDAPAVERLAALQALREELDRIAAGEPAQQPLMQALAGVIAERQLPLQPFYDLLSAFSQDVEKTRYQDFAELVDYCRRSANPVGRLMLALYGEHDSRSMAMSDGICTALQLINFWQDVAIDWQKGRVYIPQEDLAKFRISEQQIARGNAGGVWPMLMDKEVKRALAMLQAGSPLALKLKGRFGLELRMIVLGGERILKKIHDARGDVFNHRPVLGWRDWPVIIGKALWAPFARRATRKTPGF